MTHRLILGFAFPSPISVCLAVRAKGSIFMGVDVKRWNGVALGVRLGVEGVCLAVECANALRRRCIPELLVPLTAIGTLQVMKTIRCNAVGFGECRGLNLLVVVVVSPLGAATPMTRGQVAREVPFRMGGFAFSPMHTFRFGGTGRVVESFAHMAIIALPVLTQHHHMYTEVHVEERWR